MDVCMLVYNEINCAPNYPPYAYFFTSIANIGTKEDTVTSKAVMEM